MEKDQHLYDGLEKRPQPTHSPEREYECPICDGHGEWIYRKDAYGPGRHFMAFCSQCDGSGWVDQRDRDCRHRYKELSQRECGERGIQHWGNCYHVYECQDCGKIKHIDSSD